MKKRISILLLASGLFSFGNCFLLPKSDNETDASVFALLALANSGGSRGASNTNSSTEATEGGTVVTFSLGGTVTGLSGTVVLTNGGVDKTITENGSYSFDAAINSGTSYSVTVKTQPATQTCTISNGTGTIAANVTNVNVTCSANTYTLGGTVTGLSGTVVLTNGGVDKTITANGSYSFDTAIASGTSYSVTVKTQPSSQTCSVANGTGTITANVTNVNVTCSTNPTVATPTFSPSAGNQTANANITISTTTSGATIYYTTNGTTPTASSTQYSSALANIWSLAGKTIRAIAVKSGYTDSAVLSGVFSIPPLKTGQTTVYEAGDNGTNQSGINRGYTDNGNGTVTDNATGLVWQRCSRGQNNDGTCSGTATTANWADAGTYCSGLSLASRTWRLPSRQELETLLDYSTSSPAIDTTAFPATVASYYWSSTTYAPSTASAWRVNFGNGSVDVSYKANNVYVRCVSGS